jgi:hypothetical protein
MRKNLPLSNLVIPGIVILLLVHSIVASAQSPLPFLIQNNSPFNDNELYVAIVGEDLTGPPGQHVWIDCKTSTQLPMSPSYNTVTGPVYNGNRGPGTNAKYADCFTKLSDIPNKTVMLPPIQGCRLFIAKGSQLYFYFFGASGAPSGYTSPSSTDPTDPNTGILYEIIELTYNQHGFWGNTSRVDAYHYAMGLELNAANGTLQKTGELKTHADIGTAFLASVPVEFQGCYEPETGKILFPTKTEAFADGSIGTMPNVGHYVNYMKPYIDAIWEKYTQEDLIFNAGDAGIWKGRVDSEDRLVMFCQNTVGGFVGRKGIIERRPTTQEAFEGKGVLDRVIQDATTDLIVQAQMCAAITRHVVNTTTPNVGEQNWSDPSTYYLTAPCNYYAKFWHQQGISVNQLSYGFAYDDVFNQSATLHSPSPVKVTAIFGGYVSSAAVTQSPYLGNRWAIPGTVEAENYDVGGEGISFHDTNVLNEGNAYRTDGVDIETIATGQYNVGYIHAEEWLEYSVDVQRTGNYRIDAKLAATTAGKSFEVQLDDILLASFTVPNSGSWSVWQTATLDFIQMTEGVHTLKIKATSGDFNIDKLVFTFNESIATDITESMATESIYLYPNPASDVLFITSRNDLSGSVAQILDAWGREVVASNDWISSGIPIAKLNAGLYVLVLTKDGTRVTNKFIKG